MKKACLISLLMVLCSLSGCTDMEAFTDPDPTEDEEWDYGFQFDQTKAWRDCPKEVLLEYVWEITSFDVCAIEVLYAEAIDGMRFVFADGSYIDTGRVGGSSEAFYVPENHVITTLQYAIHNRSYRSPYPWMSGIVSAISFCISDQTDPMNSSEVSPGAQETPCFTITTRTYEGWANFTPKDDCQDCDRNTFRGGSVAEIGSFSVEHLCTTSGCPSIYYVGLLCDCWHDNAVTGVMTHLGGETIAHDFSEMEKEGAFDENTNSYQFHYVNEQSWVIEEKPVDDDSPEVQFDWSGDGFVPQKVGDCDASNIGELAVQQASSLSSGKLQIEPSIVFLDETFTVTYRSMDGEGPWGVEDTGIPEWLGFLIDNESGPHDLFDDGTNGDAVAGDGVYSRSCLHLPEDVLAPGQVAKEHFGMGVLDTSLRGTVGFQQASDRIRTTEGGYFVTMGESYGERWTNGWEHVSPSLCTACYDAWNVSGHVFDFIAVQTRDSVGGAGYVRFHDPVGNIGMTPPCEYGSHCYSPLDGKEHPELRGILHMQYVTSFGLSHELGHGLLGLDTRGFPEGGEGAWNSGDGMHLDSDTTVRGDISGPFWDPDRGWPHAVQIEDENGDRTEVRLIHDNGSFRIVPDDQERMVWSDIFLYMAGFLPAEDATEVNYKLINESVESCVTEAQALFCTGTNVTAERVIEFDTQDFIDMYGARIPAHDGDESQINLGVLHISDRNHTEAEVVWFTESYKEWAHSNQTSGWTFLTQNDPWPVVTRGLSSVNIDPSQMAERPLADPSILVAEEGPEEISGCGYPSSEYGDLIAPESPYGNQTLFFSDESMQGLCFLNELYHWMGEGDGPSGPPTDSSYFLGHFERTPVQNTWHNVTVSQDSEGRLWWENEAGVVWELVWHPEDA